MPIDTKLFQKKSTNVIIAKLMFTITYVNFLNVLNFIKSSLQCYSVLSDIWVKIELCIPLEPELSVLSTGNASVCLSPLSKLKVAVLFCSIYKELISFSAILF